MPNPFIKSLAKETGKSEDTLEGYWDDAIKQAKEQKVDNEYAYATVIIKKQAGVKESVLKTFFESKFTAKEYIDSL